MNYDEERNSHTFWMSWRRDNFQQILISGLTIPNLTLTNIEQFVDFVNNFLLLVHINSGPLNNTTFDIKIKHTIEVFFLLSNVVN